MFVAFSEPLRLLRVALRSSLVRPFRYTLWIMSHYHKVSIIGSIYRGRTNLLFTIVITMLQHNIVNLRTDVGVNSVKIAIGKPFEHLLSGSNDLFITTVPGHTESQRLELLEDIAVPELEIPTDFMGKWCKEVPLKHLECFEDFLGFEEPGSLNATNYGGNLRPDNVLLFVLEANKEVQ